MTQLEKYKENLSKLEEKQKQISDNRRNLLLKIKRTEQHIETERLVALGKVIDKHFPNIKSTILDSVVREQKLLISNSVKALVSRDEQSKTDNAPTSQSPTK
jgi:hypothetical protein